MIRMIFMSLRCCSQCRHWSTLCSCIGWPSSRSTCSSASMLPWSCTSHQTTLHSLSLCLREDRSAPQPGNWSMLWPCTTQLEPSSELVGGEQRLTHTPLSLSAGVSYSQPTANLVYSLASCLQLSFWNDFTHELQSSSCWFVAECAVKLAQAPEAPNLNYQKP